MRGKRVVADDGSRLIDNMNVSGLLKLCDLRLIEPQGDRNLLKQKRRNRFLTAFAPTIRLFAICPNNRHALRFN